MFCECSKIEKFELLNFNTAKVENMSGMFPRWSSLKDINLSSFETKK